MPMGASRASAGALRSPGPAAIHPGDCEVAGLPIIELQQAIPLARGASRLGYAHPGGPELLIKVMRPEVLARHRSNLAWKHRFKRARVLSVFIREIKEQLILDGKGEDSERFLQKVVG